MYNNISFINIRNSTNSNGSESFYNPDNLTISEDVKNIICNHTDAICKLLKIERPNIVVTGEAIPVPNTTGGVGKCSSLLSRLNYHPGVNEFVITLSFAKFENPNLLTAADKTQLVIDVAHEHRHIWEIKCKPALFRQGYMKDFFFNPAEIDADGFAIWYLTTMLGMDLDKATVAVFPYGGISPAASKFRMEKAKEIKAEFEKNETQYSIEGGK